MRPILSLISTLKLGSNRLFRSNFALQTANGTKDVSTLENKFGPLLFPILKKTPAAFLSVAFVYLAACNFDPFWIAHDAETEVITVPQAPGQLQTCNPAQRKAARAGELVRNQDAGRAKNLKTDDASAAPCIPNLELSLRDRPHELPPATAPPKSLI